MAGEQPKGSTSEFSTGGVVVRPAPEAASGWECILIVPTRRAADGSRVIALPKGHPDGDETPEQAAAYAVLGCDLDALGVAVARHWGLGDELLLGLTANGHLTFIGAQLGRRGSSS